MRSMAGRGHLWDDRFKSVLVEGGGGRLDRPGALWVMAQYIELNAVRAGIVKEAQAYRWCGLGEAVGGGADALGAGFVGCFERMLVGTLCMVCIVVRSRTEVIGRHEKGIFLAQYRVRYFVDGGDLGNERVC